MKILRALYRHTLASSGFGITLMALIGAYMAIGSGMPRVREYFELTDLQFFAAWPLRVLMVLMIANLAVVTWTRIPFTPPRYGVWGIHCGIVTLIVGMGLYYHLKMEGQVFLQVGQTGEIFYDSAQRSLYLQAGAEPVLYSCPLADLPHWHVYLPTENRPDALAGRSLKNIRRFGLVGQGEQWVDLQQIFHTAQPISIDIVGFYPYARITPDGRVDAISPAQLNGEELAAEDNQVLLAKVTCGSWSQTVAVPFNQFPGQFEWHDGSVQIPGADVPLQLQLGNSWQPLPEPMTLKQFDLVHYPGGHGGNGPFKDFISTLELGGEDGPHRTAQAHLNSPIYVDGGKWLYFQSGYDPQAQWSIIGVGNRPGMLIMMMGCAEMVLGLLYAFYVKPMMMRRVALPIADCRLPIGIVLLCLAASPGVVRADNFAARVDLAPLRVVAVQHEETLKTLDSYARQSLVRITGSSSLDGHDPVYTLLDMSFNPDDYLKRNIIKIRNVPLRQEFLKLASIDQTEKQRIVHDGTVSLEFLERGDVVDLLEEAQRTSVAKSNALGELMLAEMTLEEICVENSGLLPAAVIAPATTAADDVTWHTEAEIGGNVPGLIGAMSSSGATPPIPLDNYQDRQALLGDIIAAQTSLHYLWNQKDAARVNRASAKLAELLAQVNPAVYPSRVKRHAEVWYNRLLKMTIPAAIFYFLALVLLVMAASTAVPSLRRWGLRCLAIALLIHTSGIAIRWWLKGDLFPPIKNEFESILFSAWFGAVLGMGLELRFRRGFFGAAASFVGLLALLALFAVPFVYKDIGGDIGQVSGVLMSYWLYIHVTTATAAYALMAMGFMLSCWWLIGYYLLPIADCQLPNESQPKFLATLDLCNLVVLQMAFWMLGLAIIFGAIWADQSWGRFWAWDPKETFALITWIIYLIVVHVRVVSRDKAWWTAVLSLGGFTAMLFNWIGVNFFLVGLHSYA